MPGPPLSFFICKVGMMMMEVPPPLVAGVGIIHAEFLRQCLEPSEGSTNGS